MQTIGIDRRPTPVCKSLEGGPRIYRKYINIGSVIVAVRYQENPPAENDHQLISTIHA